MDGHNGLSGGAVVIKYTTIVWRADTTDGDYIYLARHPELPGCCAQGDTPEAARSALDEVREMYLAHLAAHKLPAPEAAQMHDGDTVRVHAGAL